MATTYKLGEKCAWSIGDNPEYRYVEITTTRPIRRPLYQVLELPVKDAEHLCILMATITNGRSL